MLGKVGLESKRRRTVRVDGEKRNDFNGLSGVGRDFRMEKSASRLMASTKLSDYHIKKIIRCYAYGFSPSDAAHLVRVSLVTIRKIYDLTRQRMLEVGLYRSLEAYLYLMDEFEKENGVQWRDGRFFSYFEYMMKLRPGVTARTMPLHAAELIYCFEALMDGWQNFERSHYAEIMEVIKMTGPLNRPIPQDVKRKGIIYVLRRDMARRRAKALEEDAKWEREFGPSDDPRMTFAYAFKHWKN
jgi:hypothetical protein